MSLAESGKHSQLVSAVVNAVTCEMWDITPNKDSVMDNSCMGPSGSTINRFAMNNDDHSD